MLVGDMFQLKNSTKEDYNFCIQTNVFLRDFLPFQIELRAYLGKDEWLIKPIWPKDISSYTRTRFTGKEILDFYEKLT